jgi:dTDP-4-dehydrorhamnose 3,5-epimerase
MIFRPTEIDGAYLIDLDKREDHRGFFARTWCQEEFESLGLKVRWVQANLSYTAKKGTLRGMHYQTAPSREAKLVRCTRGAIYDAIIDLRQDSTTCGQCFGVELSAANYRSLYVPEGCAHGFLALEDDTEISYQMSAIYRPELERGVRYNDPAFAIDWPIEVCMVSEKDRRWPDYRPQ